MNYETTTTPFYKSLMAGLFSGIVITVINLIFSYIYRSITSFELSMVVNITTIIFFSLLMSVVAGIVYYFIVFYAKKSKIIFILLWIALIMLLIFEAYSIHRSNDIKLSAQFHGLAAGILVITGMFEALLIPYMATHKNPVF